MESAKIVFRCVIAAVIYGVVHSEIATRVCLAYFSVYIPPIFGSTSPTFIGLAWGVIATWWIGGIMGILFSLAAQLGPRKLTAAETLPLVYGLFSIMAACAIAAGVMGYRNGVIPHEYVEQVPIAMRPRFMADLWAHTASFVSAAIGTAVVCIAIVLKRLLATPRPAR